MFCELFALGYLIPAIAITTFSRKEDFYRKPRGFSENTILATSQHLQHSGMVVRFFYHGSWSLLIIINHRDQQYSVLSVFVDCPYSIFESRTSWG